MAVLSISEKQLASRQFERFRVCLDVSKAEAIGLLVLFWHDTRGDDVTSGSQAKLSSYAPVHPSKGLAFVQALTSAGYLAEEAGAHDLYTIVGNAEAVERLKVARTRGGAGGRARAAKKKARAKPKAQVVKAEPVAFDTLGAAQPPAKTPLQVACSEAWVAYAKAYEKRLARLPIRNQKTNALILQAVQRLGRERTPKALTFYVENFNEPFFIRELWPLEAFLRKAEAIATQLDLGRVITSDDARALSETAAYQARQSDILSGRR